MAALEWEDKRLIAEVQAVSRKAIRKGLVTVARSAKAKCPVGVDERFVAKTGANAGKPWTARKPGTLKRSIRTRMSKKKLSGQVIAGARSSTEQTAFYAGMVEFGTKNMPAQPYLRPAIEENFESIMNGFKDQI